MPKILAYPDSDESTLQARHALDLRDYVLVIVCAIVAFIVGYFGAKVSGFETVWQFLIAGATILVAVIVATSILRFVSLFATQREILRQTAYSEHLSSCLYSRLEEQFPGVTDRAREIDPKELLRRRLRETEFVRQPSSR